MVMTIGLMSDMIRFSDPSQSMQLMQGMMEYDPANAADDDEVKFLKRVLMYSHILVMQSNETGNMIYRSDGPSNFEDVRVIYC